MSDVIALDEDYHVHSTFSDDAVSTLAENVLAARRRGLRTLCCAEHVRAGTGWVPDFVAAVSYYRSARGPRVLAGVEAKILDSSGRLDAPADLETGVDLVLIADHQFPGDDGPVHPATIRAALEEGKVAPAAVIECLATSIMAAFGSALRCVLAHPFSLLPKMGLDEGQVPDALLTDVAMSARRAGAMVEINEKWRCPQPRTVAAMARAGVSLVAGSDSHHCRDVGVYRTVREIASSSGCLTISSPTRSSSPGRRAG
jgi:putative hydrolase